MSIFSGLGSVGTMVAGAATVGVVVVGGIMVMEKMKAEPEVSIPLAVTAPLAPDAGAPTPAAKPDPRPDPNSGPNPGPNQTLPSFDVVRVDAEGNALVAGRALANANVRVLIDGADVHGTMADPVGSFAAFFSVPLSPQPRIVSLTMQLADGPAIASAASVILAPSVAAAPETIVAQAPVVPNTAVPDPTPLVTSPGADPAPSGETLATLQDPQPEIPAQEGTPADKPKVVTAITPEPATPLPIASARAPDPVAEGAPDPSTLVVAKASDPDPLPSAEDAGTAEEGNAPETTEPPTEVIAALAPDPDVTFETAQGPVTLLSNPESSDPVTVPTGEEIAALAIDKATEVTAEEANPLTQAVSTGPKTPEQSQSKTETLSTQTVVVTQNATSAERETVVSNSARDVAPAAAANEAPVEALVETLGKGTAIEMASAALESVGPDPSGPDPIVMEVAEGPGPLIGTLEPAPEFASLEAAPETSPLAPVVPVTSDTPEVTLLPEADPQPKSPSEPVAPSVLLADDTGIRVLQTGGDAPQVKTVVIDTITYDPSGEVALGGRGAGQGFVRAYLNNKPIEIAQIAADGQWRMPLPEVDTGVYTLRVDEVNESGTVTSRVETPFKREEPEVLAALDTRAEDSKQTAIAVLTVQPGNTLWGIASKEYGDGFLYVRVFEANKERIRNPNLIYPGQVFAIPE